MALFNVPNCPVCDGTRFSSFLTCKDHFVSGEQFDIKKCKSCGFLITENVEDEANIGSYYQSEEYISHSNTSKGVVNRLYHFVRNYMVDKKGTLVKKETNISRGHILDVGAGTGFFLNKMLLNGWQVTGTEKSPDARKFAKTEFNLELLETEKLFQLENKKFDTITLWHVLEHLHQLEKYIETFSRLLKNEGKLIIAVPNHKSYDARHYREFWAAYDVPRHIWHFSSTQLKQFGEKHGFILKKEKECRLTRFMFPY
jgi:2-polyprenyl-3-methyl-5-hydroxy-6-metoxy-1,4-benzoquinol methylase